MKFDFSEMLGNILENDRFQRFLYWLLFVDNPVRIVRLYDEAIEDLQNQVTEKRLAIVDLQVKNSQYRNELTLKNDQVLQLKYDRAHLQAQINGLECEKENMEEVLNDNEQTIFNLQADLAEAKEQQVNVQQVEELESLLRYYQMQCRELQRQAGQESSVIQPAQEGGYSPRNMPLI